MALTKVNKTVADLQNLSQSLILETVTGGIKSYIDTGLSGKANTSHLHSQYAPIDSPDFTGIPLAQTQNQGDRTRRLATTAFVMNEIDVVKQAVKPVFITPQLVYSTAVAGTVVDWTTFNLSSIVPTTATIIILQGDFIIHGPESGDVNADVLIRTNASSASYKFIHGRASGGWDNVAGAVQALFPIDTAAMSFQYTIQAPGFDSIDMYLVGYW